MPDGWSIDHMKNCEIRELTSATAGGLRAFSLRRLGYSGECISSRLEINGREHVLFAQGDTQSHGRAYRKIIKNTKRLKLQTNSVVTRSSGSERLKTKSDVNVTPLP